MNISPNAIPSHMLKLMAPDERKRLGKSGRTNEEIQVANTAKAEKVLQQNCCTILDHRNIVHCRSRMDKRTTVVKGWPDLVFAIDGKACAVEFKVGDNDLSAEQVAIRDRMLNSGWQYAVCRSEAEFLEALDRFGSKPL